MFKNICAQKRPGSTWQGKWKNKEAEGTARLFQSYSLD